VKKPKDNPASQLAHKRWANTSRADRLKVGKALVQARKIKRKGK
jgi:hypothetical protein